MQRRKTAKNFTKTPPVIAAPASQDPEVWSQLELELCWCVQQLELALSEGKLNKKLHDDTLKNLNVLKSGTAPVGKKRQVMKAACGDYRSKMKAEEKKMALASKQIKFTPPTPNKSSFVKKSAILTSGKDFKFNFNPGTSVDSVTQPQLQESEKESSSNGNVVPTANDINFSAGSEFKFNFSIEETNDDISFDKLTIKS